MPDTHFNTAAFLLRIPDISIERLDESWISRQSPEVSNTSSRFRCSKSRPWLEYEHLKYEHGCRSRGNGPDSSVACFTDSQVHCFSGIIKYDSFWFADSPFLHLYSSAILLFFVLILIYSLLFNPFDYLWRMRMRSIWVYVYAFMCVAYSMCARVRVCVCACIPGCLSVCLCLCVCVSVPVT